MFLLRPQSVADKKVSLKVRDAAIFWGPMNLFIVLVLGCSSVGECVHKVMG